MWMNSDFDLHIPESMPSLSDYATPATNHSMRQDLFIIYTRQTFMGDEHTSPTNLSYRITALTSFHEHLVDTRLIAIMICTRIVPGTPVCYCSLFYGGLHLRHTSFTDTPSVVEPETYVVSYGVCFYTYCTIYPFK
ncbi:hypothetical protein TNCV_3019081 [Trichonephila clavipes]|nr:hypothetical protein TNCV_3019081 [Trichonephila clavipes]